MQARFLVALLVTGCALTHDRPTPQCEPIELGPTLPEYIELEDGRGRTPTRYVEVVAVDDLDVVGWAAPGDVYELRAIRGCEIVAAASMPLASQYLFARDGLVEVVYRDGDTLVGERRDADLALLERRELVRPASVDGPVLTVDADGEPDLMVGGAGAVSYDGLTTVVPRHIGHGGCTVEQRTAEGTEIRPQTFDPQWGCELSDRDRGAFLDPRARETGQHAMAMTRHFDGAVVVAVGDEREAIVADGSLDVALTWFGHDYALAMAGALEAHPTGRGVYLMLLDELGTPLAVPAEAQLLMADEDASDIVLLARGSAELSVAFLDFDRAYYQRLSR